MKFYRGTLLLLILFWLGVLSWGMIQERPQASFETTLAPWFQVLGQSTQFLDYSLERVIPVNDLDEKIYGEALARHFVSKIDVKSLEAVYLNKLVQEMTAKNNKKFVYRIFLLKEGSPNTFAVPGGIILVTSGMLKYMEDEGQLIAVLAHEIGHIERGHALAAIKYELLLKKVGSPSLGQLVDLGTRLFFRHSFSKTEENEADEYAQTYIMNSQYDPRSFGRALQTIAAYEKTSGFQDKYRQTADILRDYLMSHPPFEIRIEKALSQGAVWWKNHPREKRYLGKKNLQNLQPLTEILYNDEWATAGK